MQKLVLLYWGTIFLMYLSQTYYPVEVQLQGRQNGRNHFMQKKSDIFMIIVIFWLLHSTFSECLTTTAHCQVKDKKYLYDAAPCYGCRFLILLVGQFFKSKRKCRYFAPSISIRVNAYIKTFWSLFCDLTSWVCSKSLDQRDIATWLGVRSRRPHIYGSIIISSADRGTGMRSDSLGAAIGNRCADMRSRR